MIVAKIYVCPEHIYVGHFGRAAGTAPMVEVERARLVAGRGIVGDRYFDRPLGHKGQVTFFAEETWLRLSRESGKPIPGPEVFRRNVLMREVDLPSLVNTEFEIQGVRFQGIEHCAPCFWMDQALIPGTLAKLATWAAGGLRAAVLSDGWLQAG
ncbi:MAG: molybdenum cofactor biosysynthesis protein [Opitutaceae bacterium]|nr:molybdenum cofactor biosysynthesis protein [Opitutaceae bacterium]